MTREEQINKAAEDFAHSISSIRPELNRDSFIRGAKWADETMLNKACEWLIDNAARYIVQSTTVVWYDTVALKNQFKKAMEK